MRLHFQINYYNLKNGLPSFFWRYFRSRSSASHSASAYNSRTWEATGKGLCIGGQPRLQSKGPRKACNTQEKLISKHNSNNYTSASQVLDLKSCTSQELIKNFNLKTSAWYNQHMCPLWRQSLLLGNNHRCKLSNSQASVHFHEKVFRNLGRTTLKRVVWEPGKSTSKELFHQR